MIATTYVSKIYVSKPIRVDTTGLKGDYKRADIVFHGVDHSGASFEARIFLDKPDANENTPKTPENGYAGAFHILGHGQCYGDVGHCDIPTEQRPYDPRPSHPLTPVKKVVVATDALRLAAQEPEITITVVPVITGLSENCDLTDVLKFDHIEIVTYR